VTGESGSAVLALQLAAAAVAMAGAAVLARRLGGRLGTIARGRWRWVPAGPPPSAPRWAMYLVWGAVLAMCVAEGMLVQGGMQERDRGSTRTLTFAIDVSRSMYASDVRPTRIGLVQEHLRAAIAATPGLSVAIVAFGGDAALVLPVTPDRESAAAALMALGPGATSASGTSLGQGLALAIETSRANGARDVVVVSDGESTQDDELAMSTALRAAELGIRIHTICSGTARGSSVPVDAENPAAGVTKYVDGRTVVSKADASRLGELSSATSGLAVEADAQGDFARAIFRKTAEPAESTRGGNVAAEWLMLIAVAFLSADVWLGGVRRGQRGAA
jgi:hypothetical protein